MNVAHLETSTAAVLAYFLAIYACLWCLAWLGLRATRVASPVVHSKYRSLDGVRGLLAIGVFTHHSFVAYIYFTTGQWSWTNNSLLNHLGQTTVALFFMITGFLFTLKSASPTMRWRAFYLSRFARIGPLYLLVVTAVFGLVMCLTDGQWREPPAAIVHELARWAAFSAPDINGVADSWAMIAGVNWSLKYEAYFYLVGVPVLYVLSHQLSARGCLSICTSLLIAILAYRSLVGPSGNTLYLMHFLGGIIVAHASRLEGFRHVRTASFRWIAGAAGCGLTVLSGDASATAVVIDIALFAALVGDASLFGVLHTRAAAWLGDISYGIYLIHGIVLWIVLYNLRAADLLAGLGLFTYLGIVVLMGCLVAAIASLSYVVMERPIMRLVQRRPTPNTRGFGPAPEPRSAD